MSNSNSNQEILEELFKLRKNMDNMMLKVQENVEKAHLLPLPDPESFQIYINPDDENDDNKSGVDDVVCISFTPKNAR